MEDGVFDIVIDGSIEGLSVGNLLGEPENCKGGTAGYSDDFNVGSIEGNEIGSRRDGSVDGDRVGVLVGCPEGKLGGYVVGLVLVR